jgi:hypothetical protein
MNEILPYVRGFVIGYLALRYVPQPVPGIVCFIASVLMVASGLGAFRR